MLNSICSSRMWRAPRCKGSRTPPSPQQAKRLLPDRQMRVHKPAQIARIFSVAMLLCSWLANPLTIAAHPMGNFSISHYAGIRIAPGFIEVHYLIDMAEIPTFQEMQATGIVPKENDPGLPP